MSASSQPSVQAHLSPCQQPTSVWNHWHAEREQTPLGTFRAGSVPAVNAASLSSVQKEPTEWVEKQSSKNQSPDSHWMELASLKQQRHSLKKAAEAANVKYSQHVGNARLIRSLAPALPAASNTPRLRADIVEDDEEGFLGDIQALLAEQG